MNKKQTTRLNESRLNQIVSESVKSCLIKEGLGDKLRGSAQGFKNGEKSIQALQQNYNEAINLILGIYEIFSENWNKNGIEAAVKKIDDFANSIDAHENKWVYKLGRLRRYMNGY